MNLSGWALPFNHLVVTILHIQLHLYSYACPTDLSVLGSLLFAWMHFSRKDSFAAFKLSGMASHGPASTKYVLITHRLGSRCTAVPAFATVLALPCRNAMFHLSISVCPSALQSPGNARVKGRRLDHDRGLPANIGLLLLASNEDLPHGAVPSHDHA